MEEIPTLFFRLQERLPINLQTTMSDEVADDSFAEILRDIMLHSVNNLEAVIVELTNVLAECQDGDESVKKTQTILLLYKVVVFCMTYHLANFSTIGQTNAPSKQASENLGDIMELDAKYGRSALPEPKPMNENKMKKLLAVITPYISYNLMNTEWDHFPYSWHSESPQSTSLYQDRASHFFKKCLFQKSFLTVAQEISSSIENVNELILHCRKWASRILCFLSVSNWQLLRAHIQSLLHDALKLDESKAEQALLNMDLGLFVGLESCMLNRERLVSVLVEIKAIKKFKNEDLKHIVAVVLKNSLIHWIQDYPAEYQLLSKTETNLFDGTDQIMELFGDGADSSKRKPSCFPFLTMLYCVSFKLVKEYTGKDKKIPIAMLLDALKRGMKGKGLDLSVYCYNEILRAVAISEMKSGNLFELSKTIEAEFKEKLFDVNKPVTISSRDEDNFLNEKLLADVMVNIMCLAKKNHVTVIFPAFLDSFNTPSLYKLVQISSLSQMLQALEPFTMSNPPVDLNLGNFLRQVFFEILQKEGKGIPSSRRKSKRVAPTNAKKVVDAFDGLIINHILKIWISCPMLAMNVVGGRTSGQMRDLEDLKNLIADISATLQDPSETTRDLGIKVFSRLFENGMMKHLINFNQISPEESVNAISFFYNLMGYTIKLLSKQIVNILVPDCSVKAFQQVLEIADLITNLLKFRIKFLNKHYDLALKAANSPDRYSFYHNIEIAFLSLFNSPDLELCKAGIKIIDAAISGDVKFSHPSEEIYLENFPAYEDIVNKFTVDYWNAIVSAKAHHKAVRSMLKRLKTTTAGIFSAWEEIYKRWKQQNSIIAGGGAATAHYADKIEKGKIAAPTVVATRGRDFLMQEWYNYTGCLLAMANICLDAPKQLKFAKSQNSIAFHSEKEKSSTVITPILNHADKMKDHHDVGSVSEMSLESLESTKVSVTERIRNSGAAVEAFIKELVSLTYGEAVLVRESVKEILGYEMNGKICGGDFSDLVTMFEQIEMMSTKISDGLSTKTDKDVNLLEDLGFAAQVKSSGGIAEKQVTNVETIISLSNSLLCRVDEIFMDGTVNPQDINIGLIVLRLCLFAKSSELVMPPDQSDKLKTKLCGLIILLSNNHAKLELPDEKLWRNYVLEMIIEWNSIFLLKNDEVLNTENRNRSELDHTSMKAIATLLYGLPVQHVIEQNNNLSIPPSELKTEAKQKTFMKYFSFLLKSLSSFKNLSQKQQMAKQIQNLKEKTLSSLVNLVSANMEFGVMQCIPLVYDPNPAVRKIFVDILAKIMESTMNLDPNEMDLSKYPDEQRYTMLNSVLLTDPYHVLLGLSEASGFSEIDEVATLYMQLFEARGVTIDMLTHFCKLEIQQTEDQATVFRRNSISSKLLALYGKTQLKGFINSSIGEALRRLESGEIPISFEVDPAKTENPSANHENLKSLAKLFLDLILNNENLIPESVRAECAIVSSIVRKKFPGTERMAVGGFIFLRILCPILAAPEAYDLVKITIDRSLRRGLLLVSKIIQNLSNHVFFGNKEEFMIAFNPFLNEYSEKVDKFLDAISVHPQDYVEEPQKTSNEEVVCGMRFHLLLAENMGKIEDLAIRMNPSGSLLISHFFLKEDGADEMTAAAYAAGWKQSIAAMNSFLTRLGAPPDEEALANAKSYAVKAITTDNSKQSNGYQELIQLIKNEKMFYISQKTSLESRKVFYYISHHVFPKKIEPAGFMFCLFQELKPHLQDPMDVVLDLTLFTQENDWPKEMIASFEKLLPADQRTNLQTLYVVSPNTEFKNSSKLYAKLFNSKSPKKVVFLNSIAEVDQHFAADSLELPQDSLDLMKDPTQVYNSLVHASKKEAPCHFSLHKDFLQIVYTKKHDLFGSSATITDSFRYSQIVDVRAGEVGLADIIIDVNVKGSKESKAFKSLQKDVILQQLNSLVSRARLEQFKSPSQNRLLASQSLPGILLNIAFVSLCSDSGSLRMSGLKLLSEIASTCNFRFAEQSILRSPAPVIPQNIHKVLLSISKNIAEENSSLTFDFLTECFNSFPKFTPKVKQHAVLFVSPWIKNITELEEAKRDDILNLLITLSLKEDHDLLIQTYIWEAVGEIESMHSRACSLLIQRAATLTLGSPESETLSLILFSLSSKTNSTAKIIIQSCKTAVKSVYESKVPVKLEDTPVWKSVVMQMRFLAQLCVGDKIDIENDLPDICFLLLMTFGIGSQLKRRNALMITTFITQSLVHSEKVSEANRAILGSELSKIMDVKHRSSFGIDTNGFEVGDYLLSPPLVELGDGAFEEVQAKEIEWYASILFSLIQYGSPTPEKCNEWTDRWIKDFHNIAFSQSTIMAPARSLAAIGLIHREKFDLLFLNSLTHCAITLLSSFDFVKASTLVSILTTLQSIIANAPVDNLVKLFWMGVLLIRLGNDQIFKESISLLSQICRLFLAGNKTGQELSKGLLKRQRWHELEDFEKVPSPTLFSLHVYTYSLKGLLGNEIVRQAVVGLLRSLLELSKRQEDESLLAHLLPLIPFVPAEQLGKLIGLQADRERLVYEHVLSLFGEIDPNHLNSFLTTYSVILESQGIPEDILARTCAFLYLIAEKKPKIAQPIYALIEIRLALLAREVKSPRVGMMIELMGRYLSRKDATGTKKTIVPLDNSLTTFSPLTVQIEKAKIISKIFNTE